MIDENQEMIKHSSAVQITNNINLLQRRAWNILLSKAYDSLMETEEYHISVSDLEQMLHFESNNREYLKSTLEALATCAVKWNVLSKDKTEQWGITTLLSEAIIENGILTYAYSPYLRKNLHNPKMYARISLSMQNKFSSKHALALYELCVDYFDSKRDYGETPLIEIGNFRELMGLRDNEYAEFKRLSKRVIAEPIAEINRVSDLEVEVKYIKENRKVVALKFCIKSKPDFTGNSAPVPVLPEFSQSTLFEEKKQEAEEVQNSRYEEYFQKLPKERQEQLMEEAFNRLPNFIQQYQNGKEYLRERVLLPAWIKSRNELIDGLIRR